MTQAIRLDPEDLTRISAAVHAAEGGTAGEIVTIIADHSDPYDDVALAWSAGVALLALAVLASFPQTYFLLLEWMTRGWFAPPDFAEGLRLALLAACLKFGTMWFLLLWRPLRLWLVPRIITARRVRARALTCFRVGAERRTTGRTGILIYLSLAEHRAEIIADAAIHGRVDDGQWGKAMTDLIAEVREERIADGMIAAIRDVGDVLAAHLPRADDDVNELPDRLIEL